MRELGGTEAAGNYGIDCHGTGRTNSEDGSRAGIGVLTPLKSARVLAVLGLAVASFLSSAANLVNVTIEGPTSIDSQTTVSAQYLAIAHWDDGTTSDVTSVATWTFGDNATNRAINLGSGRVVFNYVGTKRFFVFYGS